VQRRDVGVVQRGQQLGLPLEAGVAVGIGGEVLGQQLERDLAAELAVHCPPHLTHSTLAELVRNAKAAYVLTRLHVSSPDRCDGLYPVTTAVKRLNSAGQFACAFWRPETKLTAWMRVVRTPFRLEEKARRRDHVGEDRASAPGATVDRDAAAAGVIRVEPSARDGELAVAEGTDGVERVPGLHDDRGRRAGAGRAARRAGSSPRRQAARSRSLRAH